jgi:hypothetical protein
MQSEPRTQEKVQEKAQEKTQEVDPREVGITPETEPPGRIYKQVVREVLARIDQRLADIERQAVPESSDGQPRAARPPLGRRLKQVAIALLLVSGAVGATVVWWRSDGDSTKAMIARMTPRFVANLMSTQDNQETARDGDAVTVGTASGDGRSSSDGQSSMAETPVASIDRVTSDTGAQSVSPSPNVATSIEKMSRDIETLTQGLEQLRAGQEQLSRESAKATEQFKASEDQLIRMLLRVSEQQNPQPKSAAATPSPRTRTPPARTTAASPQPPRGSVARPRQGLQGLFSRRPT